MHRTPAFSARITVSATPASALAGQAGVIRSSNLRGPLAHRTLYLIMREAPSSQDGPWQMKADDYKDEADTGLSRALALIGGEFDSDDSGLVSATEADQTAAEAGGHPFQLERG